MKKLTVQKKTGIISTAITLIVVLSLIAVNIISSFITTKYPVKIDLTGNKVFELTDQSINYINSIDKEIKITVLNTKNNFITGGPYFEQAITVIEKYEKYNKNIKVEFVDLMANPTLAKQFGDLSVNVNDVVVQCGENSEKLTAYDLFNVEQSWYGGNIASSNAEQAMTGAIMNVATNLKPRVTMLTGHDEVSNTNFENLLRKNGYEVTSTMLQTEEIPQDTQILAVVAPKRDYDNESIDKLDKYMTTAAENGKNMIYFASNEQKEMPNIDAWLAKWGISVGKGIVAETSQNRVISNNGFFGIADIDDFSVTGKMTSTDVPIAVPFARPINILFTNSMGYSTQSVLSYSATSGIADETVTSINDIAISGPISVAAKSAYNSQGVNSTLYVFGTEVMLDQRFLQNNSLSNMDYFLSVFGTITNRKDTFSIAPKVLGGGKFSMMQNEMVIFSLLLTVVLPIAVLAVGFYIWVRRKRR